MHEEGFTEREDETPPKAIYWERLRDNEDARPTICLHGNGQALLNSTAFTPFAADKDLIFIHRRGTGNSFFPLTDATPDDFLAEAQLADMDAASSALGIKNEKKDYFGWSAGAALALLAAQREPEQTGRIWLYGPWLSTESELRTLFNKRAQQNPQGWRAFLGFCGRQDNVELAALPDTRLRALFNTYADRAEHDLEGAIEVYMKLINEPFEDATHMSETRKQDWNATIHAMGKFLGLEQDELLNGMERIKDHEIIALVGEHDELIDIEELRDFFNRAGCTNVHIEIVPDATHDPHEQAAQEFMRTMPLNLR